MISAWNILSTWEGNSLPCIISEAVSLLVSLTLSTRTLAIHLDSTLCALRPLTPSFTKNKIVMYAAY